MNDLDHQWGSDLSFGPTGDIAVATGSSLGQQRVLRRLLTNSLDYIWHIEYGAGLAKFVGEPVTAIQIRALIRSQVFKESAVAQTPDPTVDVLLNPAGAAGDVYVQVVYVDSETEQTQALTFTVGT